MNLGCYVLAVALMTTSIFLAGQHNLRKNLRDSFKTSNTIGDETLSIMALLAIIVFHYNPSF